MAVEPAEMQPATTNSAMQAKVQSNEGDVQVETEAGVMTDAESADYVSEDEVDSEGEVEVDEAADEVVVEEGTTHEYS